jgi:hypothetical protein
MPAQPRTKYYKLVRKIQTRYPDVKIKYKKDYWYWRILPKRIRNAGSAMNKTIWMPAQRFGTLAHEYQHIVDIQEMGWPMFSYLYILPQVFSLLFAFLLVLSIGFNLTVFTIIFSILTLGALAPWPAKVRADLETRGYMMSMYVALHSYKKTEKYRKKIIDVLTDWLYYKMVWTKSHAAYLVDEAMQVLDNEEETINYSIAFRDVHEIITKE